MNPTLSTAEGLGARVWSVAQASASPEEAWQMQFYLTKAREARELELKLNFFDRFNRLAAKVIERNFDGRPYMAISATRFPTLPTLSA